MSAQIGAGKPLRFFALLLSCWILGRVALSNQQHAVPDVDLFKAVNGVAPPPLRHVHARPWIEPAGLVAIIRTPPAPASPPVRMLVASAGPDNANGSTDLSAADHSIDFASHSTPSTAAEVAESRSLEENILSIPPLLPDRASAGRWRGSGWLLWRPDHRSASGFASAGQLGASQAGIRMETDLAPGALIRLAAYTRFTMALVQPAQPEAALGISIQPSRAIPATLAIERRIALGDGARDAMALVLAGGFGPSPVLPGLLGEGYAQAGVVGMRSRDRFVDGRFSLLKPLTDTLQAGATLSGGAQPRIHRIDVGPAVHAKLPSPLSARVMLEWRQRLAGRAYPRSGMALTIAADF